MSDQQSVRSALLTAAGETSVSLADESTPLYVSLFEGNLLSLLDEINAANGTRHFIRPSDDRDTWYVYTTRNRQWKLGAAADVALNAGTQHVTGLDGWRLTADTVVNQQKATVDTPLFPLAPILVWEYGDLPPLPLVVKSGTPLVLTATFSDYVPSCPVLHLTSTGSDATVSFINHGWNATITVSSGGTSTITVLNITGNEAVRQPEIVYTKDDTSSEALPRGIRAGPDITGDLVGPLPAAKGIADHIVWRYGSPSLRPSAVVENWLPDVLQHDLYDTIGFTSTQLNASGLIFEVVGLTEEWQNAPTSPIGPHVITTYQWAQQKASGTLFTLNSSLLDGTDVLAY